jgi:hypothetical protein
MDKVLSWSQPAGHPVFPVGIGQIGLCKSPIQLPRCSLQKVYVRLFSLLVDSLNPRSPLFESPESLEELTELVMVYL